MTIKELKVVLAKLDKLIDSMRLDNKNLNERISRYNEMYDSIKDKFVPNNKWFADSKDFYELTPSQQILIRHFYQDKKEFQRRRIYFDF